MSDLAATNCGGGCGCSEGNNSWIFLILILLFCGNGWGNSCGGGSFGGSDSGCSCIIWILLLSCICGGNGSIF